MIFGKNSITMIDRIFFNYDKIKRAVAETRAEQQKRKEGGGGGISDPTALAAINAISPIPFVVIEDGNFERKIYKPEIWLKIVTYTFGIFGERMEAELARRRYLKAEKPDYTADCMRIGQRTYYDWRNDFIMQAALMAASENLLDLNKTFE